MRVISESKTLFGMMMDNPSLYSNVKIDDLSIENYTLLEKKLKRLERKEKYLLMKLSIVKRINEDLVKNVALEIEKVNSKEDSIKNDISIFESKLAILVITKRITDIKHASTNIIVFTVVFCFFPQLWQTLSFSSIVCLQLSHCFMLFSFYKTKKS